MFVWTGQVITAVCVAVAISAITMPAGIGGGVLYVPTLSIIGGMRQSEAAAFSRVLITGAALGSIIFQIIWQVRHPKEPLLAQPYFIVAILPGYLSGAVVGVYLDNWLPPFISVVLLVIICVLASYTIFRKGIECYHRENILTETQRVIALITSDRGGASDDESITALGSPTFPPPLEPVDSVEREISLMSWDAELVAHGQVSLDDLGNAHQPADRNSTLGRASCCSAGSKRLQPPMLQLTPQLSATSLHDTPLTSYLYEDTAVLSRPMSFVSLSSLRRFQREQREQTAATASGILLSPYSMPMLPPLAGGAFSRTTSLTTSSVANANTSMVPHYRISSPVASSNRENSVYDENLEERKPTRAVKCLISKSSYFIAFVLLYWAFILGTTLLKGGDGTTSLSGVPPCGSVYWVITGVQVVSGIALTLIVLFREWRLLLVSLGFGAISTMTGISGGMLLNPLLLYKGLDPQQVAATSTIVMLISSTSAALEFVVADKIEPILFTMATTTLAGSVIGMTYVNWLVKRFGRQSFIIFMLGALVAIGGALLVYIGIADLMDSYKNGGNPFALRQFC